MTFEQVLEEQKKLQIASFGTLKEFSDKGQEFLLKKIEERKVIIEALDKQVPKKMDEEATDLNDFNFPELKSIHEATVRIYHCPECNSVVCGTDSYCSNCGQRIERSDKQ